VTGELQGACCGALFGNDLSLSVRYGVPLRVPEAGAATDADDKARALIVPVFGGMSKGGRNRLGIPPRARLQAGMQIVCRKSDNQ
jgi:hypothetical protein